MQEMDRDNRYVDDKRLGGILNAHSFANVAQTEIYQILTYGFSYQHYREVNLISLLCRHTVLWKSC